MTLDEKKEQVRNDREGEPTEWPVTFEEHQQLDAKDRGRFERYLGTRGPLWQCGQYLFYFDSYARTEPMFHLMRHASERPAHCLGIFLDSGNLCDAPWRWRPRLAKLLRSATEAIALRECLSAEALSWFDSLPPIIPIYRGCTAGRERGLSWTTDIEVATGFAVGKRCMNPVPTVVSAQIPKRHVFACFVSRNEHEIVPDYRRLRRVKPMPLS